eukprot:gene5223-10049_t
MSYLETFQDKMVNVVTQDGRVIVGVLKGFDQRVNLILDKSVERVFSSEQGVQFEPLGLYIIRGDAVVTVGEIDEVKDAELDLEEVMAAPLPEVVY